MNKKDKMLFFIVSLTLAFLISVFINLADAQDNLLDEAQTTVNQVEQKTENDVVKVLDSHATMFALYATVAFAIGLPRYYVLEEIQKLAEELILNPEVKRVEVLVVKNSTQVPKINVTNYFQRKVSAGIPRKKALKDVKSAVRKLRFPDYTVTSKKIF